MLSEASSGEVAEEGTVGGRIRVEDSKNNRIKRWISYMDPPSCVFKGKLQLTEYTNTGDWRISVEQLIAMEEKIFEVREFDLPRYEVNLELPSYAVTTDEEFTGKVSAKYTFGKPVKGKLTVLLETTFTSDRKIKLHFGNFNGEMDFSVPMQNVTTILSSSQVRVTVTVTEGLTGVKIKDKSDIGLYGYHEKITFANVLPKVYKPGLVYHGILQVTAQDGTILPNAEGNVDISISYFAPPRIYNESSLLNPELKRLPSIIKGVPRNGIVQFDVVIPSETADSGVSISANYGSAYASLNLQRAESPSGSYVQVRLKSKPSMLQAESWAKFELKSTKNMSFVDVQILSKGVLVKRKKLYVRGTKKTSKVFRVKLTQPMVPKSKLLVYYFRDGEVVSDSISIAVDGLFKNKASLKFNKARAKPNTDVTLHLKAAPGSEMHILAIDKKVLLLKKGNDITQDDVENEIQLYNDQPNFGLRSIRWLPIPIGDTDTYSIFLNTGVVVMTDLTITRNLNFEVCRYNGEARLSRKTPDSMTTWVASMFASDKKTGLGVATSTAEITVVLKEFIQITVPRCAVRGEMVVIEANFFNYGNKAIEPIKVNSNDIGTVYFPIIPCLNGELKITVLARAKGTRRRIDAITKSIKAKAEGIRQSYSITSLKVLKCDESVNESISITFPEEHVPESEYIQVSVIGDIMGPPLAGIEDLLQMSYGCGEQNLMKFVPNVFITRYLRATNRLSVEIKIKVEGLLNSGYQRQLIYRRDIGSFSAFGNHDSSGSTWLTAFVVKAFAQANEDIYIDPSVMSSAILFLLGQQSEDGSFNEPGNVIHKEMQGGSSSSSRSLTSFVVLALAEAKRMGFASANISEQVNQSILSAINYITSGGIESFENTYELGITAYALTLVNKDSEILKDILAALEMRATVENGKKYWILTDDEAESLSPFKSSWQPPITKSRALDVEVTAYIMLAFIERNDIENSLQMLKWLVTQQNSKGGFISTQDTVVALQALAALAEFVYQDNFALNVIVKSSSGSYCHGFTITNANALVLQIAEIPYKQNHEELTVSAVGTGICLLEVSVFFNVLRELRVPAFDMNVTLENETMEGFRLNICFRWVRKGRSTMALLKVGFPTGMEGDIKSIGTNEAATFKRAEQNGEDIEMYFDYVTNDESCVTVQVYRSSIVANAKKVPVTVCDYYETANTLTVFYKSTVLSRALPRDACVDCLI
ncbi:CD109 antigen-like [Ylistrum balloti]|uniref:CD109 antigen-like n=1 Tax=Ylistrum balloti TaxID=509963 RepID=UPI0029059AC8|nr:CD109 antigen-like [Ylistrum balloti]